MVKWMFQTIKPHLDKISDIRGTELRMHSDKLRLAGTADVVGHYDGLPSIIDFKNSNHMKSKEDIFGYFLQTTIYSVMVHERFGVLHPHLVIIMATEQNKALVFREHMKDYLPQALQLIKKFHKENV